MKAKEARELSLSIESERIKKQIEEVYSLINAACNNGDLICSYARSLSTKVIQKLISDGYKVSEKHDNDKGMTYTFYEITW